MSDLFLVVKNKSMKKEKENKEKEALVIAASLAMNQPYNPVTLSMSNFV
jgi:hypothetical protein